jgi:hypothetical protein
MLSIGASPVATAQNGAHCTVCNQRVVMVGRRRDWLGRPGKALRLPGLQAMLARATPDHVHDRRYPYPSAPSTAAN